MAGKSEVNQAIDLLQVLKGESPMKMRRLFGLFILLLCIILSTGMVFADNTNTDDDEADRDGEYTFTTDGERYGYESYLIADKLTTNDPVYVGARLYDVTIPEEGKLVAEIDSDQITHMAIGIFSENREEKEFISDDGVKGRLESEALPAGTYTVIFEYTSPLDSIIPYDAGGKRYFKHYITWVKAPVVRAQSLALSETDVTIEKGRWMSLTASVIPANAYYRTVKWTSSDPSVVHVSNDGDVYGVSEGTAVITAKNSDGITKNSCKVTVTKSAEESVDPTPVNPTPVNPTPVDPTPVDPTPVNPQPAPIVAPSPAAPAEIIDLPTVKISKPKAAKKKITVKWKKVSKKDLKKIGGIQIQVATDPDFTNIVKTATAGKKKTSKVIKGLSPKTKYYVRIRAYAAGDHVSGWKTKSVKVK